MIATNNDLTLQEKPNTEMSASVPAYLTFDELLKRYPTITKRCWTKKDFAAWVDQRVIRGRGLGRGETLEIHVETFEKFLNYNDEVMGGLADEGLREIDEFKKKKTRRRRSED